VTKEKVQEITECIARLADIEGTDFGVSATTSGRAFLPLPNQSEGGAMILMDHQLKSSNALQTLVAIGPEALPFLLDALDDNSPTKLKLELERDSFFGAMWLANELWGNPVNDLEMKILAPSKQPEAQSGFRKPIQAYTVTIGDVCLVAIGQIAGRGYQAVRYQPTANIVINSPTENQELREQVRSIWASDDPASRLLHSLLVDYATEGVFQGPSLDSWSLGSELQVQAAMRLLYYYPNESAALVAERLRKLDINRTSNHGKGSPATQVELAAYVRREVSNGVRTDSFIKAVSWCQCTPIRAAIRAIFVKTDDIDIMLAALPGVADSDGTLVSDRLQKFLDAVPAQEGGAYGDGYHLFVALAEQLGPDSARALTGYLDAASPQRCYSAALAFRNIKGDWCIPILERLLDDKRGIEGYTYAVDAADRSTRISVRVCDAVAETLHLRDPDLPFVMRGEYSQLDEQIKAIRGKLSKKRE